MSDIKVTSDNATEGNNFCWATEASELGLKPGHWPDFLPTTLGNGLAFILESLDETGGRYRQQLGVDRLTVFND